MIPYQKSRLSYILLTEDLRQHDTFVLEKKDELYRYLKFRRDYLTQELKTHGVLKCAYCPATNLVIGSMYEHKKNQKNTKLATIDHIIPLDKGGGRLDPNNVNVSCRACNQRKGNTLLNDKGKIQSPEHKTFQMTFEYFDGTILISNRDIKARSIGKAKRKLRKQLKKDNINLTRITNWSTTQMCK